MCVPDLNPPRAVLGIPTRQQVGGRGQGGQSEGMRQVGSLERMDGGQAL